VLSAQVMLWTRTSFATWGISSSVGRGSSLRWDALISRFDEADGWVEALVANWQQTAAAVGDVMVIARVFEAKGDSKQQLVRQI
jgi:hypothetical protein